MTEDEWAQGMQREAERSEKQWRVLTNSPRRTEEQVREWQRDRLAHLKTLNPADEVELANVRYEIWCLESSLEEDS